MSVATQAIQTAMGGQLTFTKFLAANDTGLTGGHQAGIYISKPSIPILFDEPGIKGQNKEKWVKVKWQDDFETETRFIYYGQGTRNSCFEQAVKWELMEKNPTDYASVPKAEYKKRDIWTAETLFQALELCEDERLKLCLNLAFACSLRMGELLGLTWDCVEISDEAIAEGKAYIQVNKELQRVSRDTLKKLDSKDVMLVFPPMSSRTTTVQVLKAPKTSSSVRKIFLPRTVAEMLIRWKEQQMETIEALGDEYQDFDLVIAGPLGMPTEAGTINASFRTLIEKNDLPRVVFHSLRHSSITYKLKLNGGDVKAVQGDSGHAQVKMVTDVYSHILDDDRRNNARLFEEAFYSGAGKDPTKQEPEPQTEAAPAADVSPDTATLLKLLQNPEMAALLKTLAKSL